MRAKVTLAALAVLILGMTSVGAAEKDGFGKLDTLYCDIAQADNNNWTITVNYTNDEWVEAFSIPLHLDAGDVPVKGDSAVYDDGRVADFDLKGFRADSAIQAVTMGIMANLGPSDKGLPPGSGRLLTVFVSARGDETIKQLTVDTVTTPPDNSLMAVARFIQPGDPPDTIPLDQFEELVIIPKFVVRQPE